jgi:hypothetical protein
VDIDDSMKGAEVVESPGGGLGGGEKASILPSVSYSRMAWREFMRSQGGGAMLARRCFLRRRASQRGMFVLCGGTRGGVGPCEWLVWCFEVQISG